MLSNDTTSTTSCSISKSTEDYLATWKIKWLTTSSLSSASPQGILFMVYTISRTPVDTEAISRLDAKRFGEGELYLDEQGILHQKYGVAVRRGQGSIVVLRPDSHIGYRVQGANKYAWEDVNGYFKSILARATESKLRGSDIIISETVVKNIRIVYVIKRIHLDYWIKTKTLLSLCSHTRLLDGEGVS
ncbi:hypothetical protein BGZ80_006630 [Entomortierella chlamydospora]|uniref:Phenol hydroxylase-like C-terminal dimerisation domain-containing protein n=1 Tax=Entomortierella chlamydospora TaxID=101097 RepID=A0A9P6MH29_9FUNG|nr:hypothetical protein BGZ79_004156 [Entomortierella chlamydospora]KAF9999166.1 hypothetical protein BGZ80_006630 [Entomortierella chlamydospora]